MFSVIIPRKSVGNRGESLVAYDSKQIYFIYSYTHKDNPISYKEFFKKFAKYVELTNFKWEHVHKKGENKGKTCYPNPETARSWPSKYDWDNDYNTYENYMNGTAQDDVLDRYLKSQRESGKSLVEIKQNLEKHILKGSQLPFFELMKTIYPLAKMGELLSMIDDMIQKDIDFRNVEEDGSQGETSSVPVNPEHEDQHIRDIWTEKAYNDVIPR